MKDIMVASSEQITMTEKKKVTVGEIEIEYSFYNISVSSGTIYYAIEVVCGRESGFAVIGKDEQESYGLYDLIVRLDVTPCTFYEIIKDHFQKKQY